MAGGKETPRQKMIGMMYLVLTALLALQVSNAVLEKFIFIDKTLKKQATSLNMNNGGVIKGIEAQVQKNGNVEKDVAVLNRAKKVREATTEIKIYLDDLREQMAEMTGGYTVENGDSTLVGAKDYDIVGNYMIKKGNGKKLQQKLNTFATFLGDQTEGEFEPLAKDAKDIPYARNNPNQRDKDFTSYYFENTPTAAGMATISFIETEVLNYETKALDLIAKEVGAERVSFDKIVPLIRPEANIVAAGSKFKAELFITASATGLNPTFKYNGTTVKSEKDAETGIIKGVIEFNAKGGNYDPKTLMSDKSFNAEIELNGKTYPINHKYKVVKPVVQIKSAALSALYLNCGNTLDIQVPALGTNYNPSFSSGDAKVIKGTKTGIVTIVPTAKRKVKLTISNAGAALSTEVFDVKTPPLPRYEFKSGGKKINFKTGAKATALRSLDIKPVPDANFAREVPKDSKYRIREMEVILARGTRPVVRKKFTSERVNLQQYASQARPGDKLVIEIKKTTRRTYTGANEKVPTRNEIYTIPLN